MASGGFGAGRELEGDALRKVMAMKRRILVVEDEESAREGLLEALSASGYEACGAASDEEACRIFHQTLLLVTHDLQIARKADVLLTLEDGRLVLGE
jgi:CheY-like chemotaxis protein